MLKLMGFEVFCLHVLVVFAYGWCLAYRHQLYMWLLVKTPTAGKEHHKKRAQF
jgi:hypothetical protein